MELHDIMSKLARTYTMNYELVHFKMLEKYIETTIDPTDYKMIYKVIILNHPRHYSIVDVPTLKFYITKSLEAKEIDRRPKRLVTGKAKRYDFMQQNPDKWASEEQAKKGFSALFSSLREIDRKPIDTECDNNIYLVQDDTEEEKFAVSCDEDDSETATDSFRSSINVADLFDTTNGRMVFTPKALADAMDRLDNVMPMKKA